MKNEAVTTHYLKSEATVQITCIDQTMSRDCMTFPQNAKSWFLKAKWEKRITWCYARELILRRNATPHNNFFPHMCRRHFEEKRLCGLYGYILRDTPNNSGLELENEKQEKSKKYNLILIYFNQFSFLRKTSKAKCHATHRRLSITALNSDIGCSLSNQYSSIY